MKTKFIAVSMQRLITFIFCLALIGCSQGRLKPKTIRICDASGCSERPGDYASYDPSITDPQDGLAEHIPELEAFARKEPSAAYDLGLRYFRGDGVRQDSYQALKWMRDAAERGDITAQKALGRLYLTGLEEMGSDPREAHKWLAIAASRGDNEAKILLKEAVIARKNDESYRDWSNQWRPVFYRNWYNGYSYHHYWRHNRWSSFGAAHKYSAELTDKLFVVDCLLPGQIRNMGEIRDKRPIKSTAGDCEMRGGEYSAYNQTDYATSLKNWLPQAKEGDVEAQVIVGEMYENGLGDITDPKMAAQWYRKAAEQGSSRAQINLGHLYEKGLGVEQNLPEALSWYRKASGVEKADLEFASVTQTTSIEGYDKQLEDLRRVSESSQQQTDKMQQQLNLARQSYVEQQKKLASIESQLKQARKTLAQEKNKNNVDQQLIKEMETEKAELLTLEGEIKQLRSSIEDNQKIVADLETQEGKNILSPDREIEMIEPSMAMMQEEGVYRLRSLMPSKKIIGKVQQAKDLQSLTVNGLAISVNEKGVFQTQVDIIGSLNPVEIIASYKQEKPSKLSFNLLAKTSDLEPKVENQHLPVISTAYKSVDFGRFYALVIGNQNYTLLPDLETSVSDARAVEEVLRLRYGYKTILLINANRHQVMTAFNDLRKTLTEEDNLLIYYAGHGEIDKTDQSAYWLPIDAELDNSANWLSSHSIAQYLNILAARHILVVADSCYSGAMTQSSVIRLPEQMPEEKRKKWLNFMVKRKARTVLTSGGLKPVLDTVGGKHSIFAKAFLNVLNQNSGLMEDYELFRTVSAGVQKSASLVGFQQLPQYSAMLHAGHEGSPFFFVANVNR